MGYVLIIEDDIDFARAVARVLEADGHQTSIETDPSAALEAMATRQPDLVILDLMFPGNRAGGFEVARAMRRRGQPTARVPILMLTAVNTQYPLGFGPQDIDDEWLPVTEFLEKPVELDDLRRRVAALICKPVGGENVSP